MYAKDEEVAKYKQVEGVAKFYRFLSQLMMMRVFR